MSREARVQFWEGLGVKLPGLLTQSEYFVPRPHASVRSGHNELCGNAAPLFLICGRLPHN
jgi:hypothetical protein